MLDDFLAQIRALERKIQQLDGKHTVSFGELFNDEFMLRNTEFSSIGDMLGASGFKIETTEDFAAVPDEPWDAFVKKRTRFDSWEKMKGTAAREWAITSLEIS